MAATSSLHVGVDVRDVHAVSNAASGVLVIAGDGWEVWGEPVATAGNDDRTLHVVIPAEERAADLLMVELASVLVSLRWSTVVAVQTPADDWSIDETGGRLWHRLSAVDGCTRLVVEYVTAPSPERAD